MDDILLKQAAPSSQFELERQRIRRDAEARRAKELRQQKIDYQKRRQEQEKQWRRLGKAKETSLVDELRHTSRSGGSDALPSYDDIFYGRAKLRLPKLSEHDDAYMNRWLSLYNRVYGKNVTLDQLKQRLSGAYSAGREQYQQIAKDSRRSFYNPARWTWFGGHAYDLSQQAQRLNRAQNAAVVNFNGDPLAYAESIERQNALAGKSSTYMSAKPYQQKYLGSNTAGQQLLQQGEDVGRRGEYAQYVNGRFLNGLTFGLGGNLAVGIGNALNGQGYRNINDIFGDYTRSAKNEFGDLYGAEAARGLRRWGTAAELAGTALSTWATMGVGNQLQAASSAANTAANTSRGLSFANRAARGAKAVGKAFLANAQKSRWADIGLGAVADELEDSSANPWLTMAARMGQGIAHSSPYLAGTSTALAGIGRVARTAMSGSKFQSWLAAHQNIQSIGDKAIRLNKWFHSNTLRAAPQFAKSAPASFIRTGWYKYNPVKYLGRTAVDSIPGALGWTASGIATNITQGGKPEVLNELKENAKWLVPAYAWGSMGWPLATAMLAGKSNAMAVWTGAPQYDENGKPITETYEQQVDKAFNQMLSNPNSKAAFIQRHQLPANVSDAELKKLYNQETQYSREANAELSAKLSLLPKSQALSIRNEAEFKQLMPELDKLWERATPEQRRSALAKVYRSEAMAGGPMPEAAFNSEELSAQDKENNLAIALGVADKEGAGTGKIHQIWDMTAGDAQNIALRAMHASPAARSAVISYAGGLIRDTVKGKLDPKASEQARQRYAGVLNNMTSEEKTQMFDTLLMDPKTSGKQLADIMRNSGAYGLDNPEMRKAAAKAVAQRMTMGIQRDPKTGMQGSGDFAAEFLPEFTSMLKSGAGIGQGDRQMFAEVLSELPENAAYNMFFTADDDNFNKLARMFMSDSGQGMLDSLPEERRNAIKATWEQAAQARVAQSIRSNPMKNLPLAASLFMQKQGWNGAADFLGNPIGFYGVLALLLTGGVWLGSKVLGGLTGGGDQDGDVMAALQQQRQQLARMTFGGMNG